VAEHPFPTSELMWSWRLERSRRARPSSRGAEVEDGGGTASVRVEMGIGGIMGLAPWPPETGKGPTDTQHPIPGQVALGQATPLYLPAPRLCGSGSCDEREDDHHAVAACRLTLAWPPSPFLDLLWPPPRPATPPAPLDAR
jgi:hypothetical protein